MTSTDSLPPVQHFINGKWTSSCSESLIDCINPANEEVFAQIPAGDEKDVNSAVSAASEAFSNPKWVNMVPAKRAKILWRFAELIDENRAKLADCEILDAGKTTFDTTKIEIPIVSEIFRYYAGWVTKMNGEVIDLPGNNMGLNMRVPVGVCAFITPWNFPLLMAAWKIAPALACGNTVVLKPSEFTSHTSLWLAQLGSEAGLPDGVLNVVTGTGPEVGMALVKHPDVDKVSFTGSTRVGKLIQHECTDSLKRVTLELGGKSPNIIFADANLKAAVRGAASGIFYNKGEVCAAGSRVLVQREIYDAFVEGLAAMAGKTTVGPPTAEGTRMGPVCNAAQYEKVLAAIEQAKSDGARLVAGGNSLRDEVGGGKGYYIEATVFADVDPDSALAQEEVFGPVVAVIPFDDEAHALEIAHNSRYGLAAGVFTRDIGRALNFAKQLRAGTVWVNTYNMYDPSMSFGGFGESGYGRELGTHALDTYTESKSIWLNLD
ncbi:MAG: aldehyde dehydrogenase family protein [Planctomycetota bacterium]|nr:aldehyde dehydrogenase family protein [Planctomycetota bacterium]